MLTNGRRTNIAVATGLPPKAVAFHNVVFIRLIGERFAERRFDYLCRPVVAVAEQVSINIEVMVGEA
jgi:hypothetical protein